MSTTIINEPPKRYRHKYPEAEHKRDYYTAVANRLETFKQKITSELTSAKISIINFGKTTDLSGEYYNIYCAQKNAWIDEQNAFKSKFNPFIMDLIHCIKEAKNLAELWDSRIDIMEEY